MLVCDHVSKKYRRTDALTDVSLELKPGHIYALLGPNGSGKSTLMKVIAGLSRPTSGSVSLDGKPVDFRAKAHIAYMPTEPYYFSYMTARDFGDYFHDFFEDFSRDQFRELLERMDLEETKKLRELSSGMFAKMKIAATLSRSSRIILLDEPLNGVDIIARDQIMEVIHSHASEDAAMVISSHLVDELEQIVDSAIYMKHGNLVMAGSVDSLFAEHGKSLTDLYREIYG